MAVHRVSLLNPVFSHPVLCFLHLTCWTFRPESAAVTCPGIILRLAAESSGIGAFEIPTQTDSMLSWLLAQCFQS